MAVLKVDPDKLVTKIVTPDFYELQFQKFKPKSNKNGDSINLNAVLEVVNHPVQNGAVVFEVLSLKMETFLQDFVHACGLTMGDDGGIPGEFNMVDPDNPATWTYSGPLAGKIIRAEVVPTIYDGRMRNNIKRYVCVVPSCATRFPQIVHSQNMISGK